MDIDYRKPSAELVFDLINRDNPQLPFKLSSDTTLLGTPTVQTVVAGKIQNTKVSINPKEASGYLGAQNVTYQRLTGTSLFKTGVYIDDWYDGVGAMTTDWVLAQINRRYGTALVASDITAAATIGTANGNVAYSATLLFAANCPAFIGGLSFHRLVAKKPVSAQVPEITTGIALLSAGALANADNIADWLTYGTDFSRFASYLATLTTLTVLPTTPKVGELIQYMGMASGLPLDSGIAATVRNGMAGCRAIRYALPNVNVPEANSVDYNNVVVITPPATGGWFTGRFLLHYKV